MTRIPGLTGAGDCVEDGQQFSTYGDKRYLLGFASGQQSLVEGFQYWVMARGN